MITRVGRRCLFLLTLATMHLVYGAALLVTPRASLVTGYHLPVPLTVWGGVWVGTGVLCVAAAAAHRLRVAFTAAAFLHSAWACQFLYLWVTQQYQHVIAAVSVWAWIAAVVLLVSSWPDPPPASNDDRGTGEHRTGH